MFNFDIPDDVLNEAQQGVLLTVPGDAQSKGDPRKPGGVATWAQGRLLITESSVEPTEKDTDNLMFKVKFQIPPDEMRGSGPDPNAGRDLTQTFFIHQRAVGNPSHEKFKAAKFTLGRLSALVAACGFEPKGSGFGAFFAANPSTGDQPIIVGSTISAIIRRSWYEGKAKDEITDFIPLDVASA